MVTEISRASKSGVEKCLSTSARRSIPLTFRAVLRELTKHHYCWPCLPNAIPNSYRRVTMRCSFDVVRPSAQGCKMLLLVFLCSIANHAFASSLHFGLGDSFAGIFNSEKAAAPRPTVINLAIDGETAKSFFKATGPTTPQATMFSTRLASERAEGSTIDTVNITLGFNELAALSVLPVDQALAMLAQTLAAYKRNNKNILSLVRNREPEANLYLLNYYNPFIADSTMKASDVVFTESGPRLHAILRSLATQFNAQYVDTFTPFSGREAELTYTGESPAGSTTPPQYSPSDSDLAPSGKVLPNDLGYQAIADQIASVPEPANVTMVGLGVLCVAAWRVRRRRLSNSRA